MHARRFASFCLGLWLAGSLIMAFVAYENLRQVDRLLSHENPVATLRLKPLGPDARAILRYAASEQNRWYFAAWANTQLIFGGLFFLLMLFGSRESKLLLSGILLVLALVLVQKFVVAPNLTDLGREIDFLAPGQRLPEQSRYWIVSIACFGVEGVKGLLTLMLAGQMIFSRQGSGRLRDARRELDGVDKADHRHVYR